MWIKNCYENIINVSFKWEQIHLEMFYLKTSTTILSVRVFLWITFGLCIDACIDPCGRGGGTVGDIIS